MPTSLPNARREPMPEFLRDARRRCPEKTASAVFSELFFPVDTARVWEGTYRAVDERFVSSVIAAGHVSCYTYASMDLPAYIRKIGTREFAEKFGVTERAAVAYQQRARRPRPQLAQQIVDQSPVTWEGIYSPRRPAVPTQSAQV